MNSGINPVLCHSVVTQDFYSCTIFPTNRKGALMKSTLKASMTLTMGAALMSFAALSAAQDVTGAGASFPAPLYAKWAADYNKATSIKINYQSVGSGAGIKQIEAKTVDFGASDAPKSTVLASIWRMPAPEPTDW